MVSAFILVDPSASFYPASCRSPRKRKVSALDHEGASPNSTNADEVTTTTLTAVTLFNMHTWIISCCFTIQNG